MPPKRAAKAASPKGDVFTDKVFALSGTLTKTRDEMTKLLEQNGATVASSVTKKVTHLLTTQDDFADGSSKVQTAQKNGIFIVKEDFIHDSIAAGKAKEEETYVLKDSEGKAEAEAEAEEKPAKKTTKKPKKVEIEEEKEEEEKPKGKKRKASKAEEEEEVKPKKKAAKKTKAEVDEDDDEEEEKKASPPKDDEVKKKIIVKGRAAVDALCHLAKSTHVLEEGGEIYDAMLNQTNISHNNNKFYVIQVLEADSGGSFYAWNRWGRVGEPGQNKLEPCGSNKAKAIASFKKKFHDKTKNHWDSRASFTSKPGLYTLIEIDYGADVEPEPAKAEKKKDKGKQRSDSSSKLDTRVQDLVKLIFDLKMMENTMTEMEFDVKKSPLGKLTKKQIKDGYEVLKQIDEAIKKGQTGSLTDLTSRFYTLIPHSFGRQVPPVIKNAEILKKKMQMLEALADIEIATKLMKQTEESDQNPIDANYAQLKCEIAPVEPSSEEYNNIATYVKNTHQGKVPKIKNVYRINREGEKGRFDGTVSMGNRKLLWHGSRLTNYVGIISQGLRIAPPEAPVSGYRFGKGIYFADIMSLSSIYCRSSGSNDFCMLLGDVVLGKEAELERDTYMEKPIAGTHSTKALGTIEPSPKDTVVHPDGYMIPNGKIVDSGKKGVSCREHQYIVYDVSQVHLRYMLHLNWE